jgi:hypothetical protein
MLAFVAFDGTQALFPGRVLSQLRTRCNWLMMTFTCCEVVEVRGRTTKKLSLLDKIL